MTGRDKIRIFRGATVIITGGASGIGLAFAEELSRHGCDIVLADRQFEAAREAAGRLSKNGSRVWAVKTDVTKASDLERLVKGTVKKTGRLDYMFNNAGIAISGDCSKFKLEDWDNLIDVNLRGVIHGVQSVYGIMLDQGFGHIVNTASIAGLVPGAGNIGYATTKHAVVGLTNALRCEAASYGIRVSALCPGFIRTPILTRGGKFGRILVEMTPEQEQKRAAMIEKFRPMDPQIFARKALQLIAKNEPIIILPRPWKLLWLINRISPAAGLKISADRYRKNLKSSADLKK